MRDLVASCIFAGHLDKHPTMFSKVLSHTGSSVLTCGEPKRDHAYSQNSAYVDSEHDSCSIRAPSSTRFHLDSKSTGSNSGFCFCSYKKA